MDRLTRAASAVLWPATALAGVGLLLVAEQWGSAVVWALAIILADQIPVATPSGGRVSPALGLAIAMPLLVDDGTAVAAAFSVALAVSHVLLRLSRRSAAGSFLRHVFGYGLLLVAFYVVAFIMGAVGFEGRVADLVVMTVAGAVWLLADTAMRTAGAVGRLGMVRYLWLVAIQDWPVVVALFASGGLFAFAFPSMRWWARASSPASAAALAAGAGPPPCRAISSRWKLL